MDQNNIGNTPETYMDAAQELARTVLSDYTDLVLIRRNMLSLETGMIDTICICVDGVVPLEQKLLYTHLIPNSDAVRIFVVEENVDGIVPFEDRSPLTVFEVTLRKIARRVAA